jgi:hypothetical protein
MPAGHDSEFAPIKPLCGGICVSHGCKPAVKVGKMFEPRSGGTDYDTDTVRDGSVS